MFIVSLFSFHSAMLQLHYIAKLQLSNVSTDSTIRVYIPCGNSASFFVFRDILSLFPWYSTCSTMTKVLPLFYHPIKDLVPSFKLLLRYRNFLHVLCISFIILCFIKASRIFHVIRGILLVWVFLASHMLSSIAVCLLLIALLELMVPLVEINVEDNETSRGEACHQISGTKQRRII